MSTSSGSEDRGLEKKIHKSALIKTVAVLNANLDAAGKKKETGAKQEDSAPRSSLPRRKTAIRGKQEDEEETPKTRRRTGIDKHGFCSSKQKRNATRKGAPEVSREDAPDAPKKMTRKERKQEKIVNRGRGMSSKEYYETVIKKKSAETKTKESFPSKRKQDFPRDDGKKPRFSKARK